MCWQYFHPAWILMDTFSSNLRQTGPFWSILSFYLVLVTCRVHFSNMLKKLLIFRDLLVYSNLPSSYEALFLLVWSVPYVLWSTSAFVRYTLLNRNSTYFLPLMRFTCFVFFGFPQNLRTSSFWLTCQTSSFHKFDLLRAIFDASKLGGIYIVLFGVVYCYLFG